MRRAPGRFRQTWGDAIGSTPHPDGHQQTRQPPACAAAHRPVSNAVTPPGPCRPAAPRWKARCGVQRHRGPLNLGDTAGSPTTRLPSIGEGSGDAALQSELGTPVFPLRCAAAPRRPRGARPAIEAWRPAGRLALALALTQTAANVRAEPPEESQLGAPEPPSTLPAPDRGSGEDAAERPAASAAAEAPRSEWRFSWDGWQGLNFELVQKTYLEDDRPLLRLDQLRLAGALGATLEVDAAHFRTDGSLSGFDDGVELRRARLKLRGDAILGIPFQYRVDLGYVPNEFTVTKFYVAVPDLAYVGTLQFGKFQPAMGLQLLISSWDIAFMEPAAPLQAIAPGNSVGVQVGRPFTADRGTWALGLYGSASGSNEYGSAAKNLGSAIGRATWLALDPAAADRSAPNRLLHLGLSGNLQFANKGELRFRSRPESFIAPYVIDTGTIDADKAATVAGEVAWVDGSFSAQGEFVRASVRADGGGTQHFGGLYAMASWTLTGESRPYDRLSGTFTRLRPRRDFGFGGDAGWGALEAALRVSYTDLNDGNVQGGRLSMLMTALNWYLQPHLTWHFNVGMGKVQGAAANGNMLIVQTRVGIDF